MRLSSGFGNDRFKFMISDSRNDWLILSLIILAGVILRIYFFTGHIFSDDAYYARLSLISLQNSQNSEYQGYPIFLLRKLFTWLNSLSFGLFGINEISSVLFPFFISILNMFLIYLFSILLFEEAKKRLLSVFFLAFFPLEITFASISFPDQMNVFLINLGLFLLYLSVNRKKLFISVIAGFLFSISFLVKENFIYVSLLLLLLFLYKYIKEKKIIYPILISLSVVVIFF
jgi:4-amino-4-deoxy-L-arabinose transferase-like glycosyltransferase